jgi:hypothetical protein
MLQTEVIDRNDYFNPEFSPFLTILIGDTGYFG